MHFIDSNIWLYGIIESDDVAKHDAVVSFLDSIPSPIVSTQVVNEVCANAIRKASFNHQQVAELIASFDEACAVVPVTLETINKANELRARYSLSFWDSQIVACALVAGCSIVHSEDMQDGLVIDDVLTIRNPMNR